MSGMMIGWVLLAVLVLVVTMLILAGAIARRASGGATSRSGAARGSDRSSDFAHFPWLLWWSDSSLFARSLSDATVPRAGSGHEYSSGRVNEYSSARARELAAPHAHDQSHHGAVAFDPFSPLSGFGTHEVPSGAAGFGGGCDMDSGGTGVSVDSGGGGSDAGGCDAGSS